jgi:cobalamin synthase
MIGKKEWFKRRKYSGWGLTPTTWQGWAYTAVMISPLIALSFFQVNAPVLAVIIGWFVIFAVDIAMLMVEMPRDEREAIHEALSERNALWIMIAILIVGVGYQTASSVAKGNDAWVDPVIIVALIGALIAKAVTNYWLDKKD